MADAYAVIVSGESALTDNGDLSPKIARAAQRAINRTIERARTASGREIRKQVAFGAQYLSGSAGRLTITQKATETDLKAIVTGRTRPTSLAQFATPRAKGVDVTVQPGLARHLDRAFMVKLRSGNTDTKNNAGLAIRLPEGKAPGRAYRPKLMGNGLWLLYGPSVGQVFDDVALDISPDTLDFLEREFLRLVELEDA